MSDKVRMSIQMKKELHEELKQLAEENGASMSYYATMIINNHIKTYRKLYEKLTSTESLTELMKELDTTVKHEYQVQCDYGKGFETVATEESEEEAKRVYQEYIDNDVKAKDIRIVAFAIID